MRRLALGLGILVVAAAPIAGAALHASATRAAGAELDRFAKDLPGLHVASVAVDPWFQRIIVRGLAWRRAGLTVQVRSVTLPLPSPFSFFPMAAYAQDASSNTIDVQNVEIDAGALHYTAKRIDLSGTSLSRVDLNAILDPKSALSPAERVAKISASRVGIPELVMQTTVSGRTQKDVYSNIILTDVAQGHVGQAAIDQLVTSLATSSALIAQSAYGPITMTGVDLPLAARIISDARQNEAEPLKPLYESVAVGAGKILLVKPALTISTGSMTLKNVRARPLLVPLASLNTIFASDDEDDVHRRAAAYLADVLSSIEVDAVSLNNLQFSSTQSDANFTASLTKAALAGMTPSKIDALDYDHIAVETKNSKIRIDNLSLRGVDIDQLRNALKKAAKEDNPAGPHVRAALVREMTMNELDVTTTRPLSDTADKGVHFELAKLGLATTDPIDGIASHFIMTADHFTMGPVDTTLGYDKLDISSRLETHYDPAKNALSLDELSLTGADMGSLKVNGSFNNVRRELFSSDPAAINAAALDMLIQRVGIKVVNNGLMERWMNAEAKKDEVSTDDVRDKYVSAAAFGLPLLLGDSDGARAIIDAVEKFITAPKNLRIVASAPDGLKISEIDFLRNLSTVLDKLSIDAAANE